MSDLPGALAGLTPEQKRAMLARLLRERAEKPRTFPASWAQRTLWFLEQMSPGRTTYNMHAPVRVTGPLDPDVLQRAINEIVRRHEALRTTFNAVDGEPVQVIASSFLLEIPLSDLRALPESERKEQARRLATEELRRPFDLARGPLFRVRLLRLGEEEHVVLLTLHHINADGWSVQIFKRELVALYDAFSRGLPSPLPEPPIQYADYAVWQRRTIDEGGGASLEYWRMQLAGVPALDLPTDRPRPAVQTVRGANRPFRFPARLADGLRDVCRRARCTPFMALLAAFQVLLHRYSGQDDIAVGSPYANRTRPEVEGVIGYFVNLLVLRGDLSGDPTFLELLGRTRAVVLGAIKHQDLPFNKIVEELRVPRDLSRHPLFQVMFAYQNAPRPNPNLSTLKLDLSRQPHDGGAGASKFELTLVMFDTRKGLKGRFQYNSDLFDPPTIDRLIAHFQRLIEGIVADPSRRVSEFPLIDDAERALLVERWASPRVAPRATACVHRAFEAQAARTPDAVALVHEGEAWTYAELNGRANQVAHHLRALGVGPEVRVGLLVDRSPALIVGLFGILKAGGAYVPIDPAQPGRRLQLILDDSRADVIVTEERHRGLVAVTTARLVLLDSDWEAIAAAPVENPNGGASDANLAYILYTSGTTGRPKGVMIEHRSLAHYTEAATAEYAISSGDRVLQFASIGFDASAEEIFPCLTRGGTLVLRSERMLDSYAGFLQACGDQGITVISLPTAYWHELTATLVAERLRVPSSIRLVIIGGEAALGGRLVDWSRAVGRAPRLLNTYGPTEATVVATSCDLGESRNEPTVLIGRPLQNVRAHVLDRNLGPVPTGVPGEIFLGGPGLARGYANQPGATAERFLPDPLSGMPGDRLCRTGDLGRWRSDGRLEYLGRCDEQVKIRGHRVELGEVESALLGHPAVQENAVLALDDARAGRRLVAYVVFAGGRNVSAGELRTFLRGRLPEPMVPSAFVPVASLPRSSSGKLDRGALPAPEPSRDDDTPPVPPRTETERRLVAIWSELLGRETVGIEDSFFDLGGHSLLAIRASARIREEFQVELPLPRLFLAPTIAALAPVIDQLVRSPGSEAPELSTIDLEADGTLDPKIQPAAVPVEFMTEPTGIFLTGATGFLGSSLLHDLLRETNARVFCLVRCSSDAEGTRRLRESLESRDLWDDAFSARIVAVRGDLGLPRFGLSKADFDALAGRVQVIYHNSALVNTIQPYEMLRDVNVLGTQEVLRLACTGSPSTVHYVSTLTVLKSIARSADDETIREAEPLGPGTMLRGGYGRSKWAAERLMADARSRGVPVCVYRPGRISGHSRTGRCDTNDTLFLMLQTVNRAGCVPALKSRLNLVPVDFVSRAIVHLSRRTDSRNLTFHLFNPETVTVSELVERVRALGAPIRIVTPDDWRRKIEAIRPQGRAGAGAMLALRPPRRKGPRTGRRRTIDCTNTREGLSRSGIVCPPIDDALIETYYSYLKRSGLLDGE